MKNFLKYFPNQSAKFYDWKDIYLGYDTEQDSICILNRTHSPNKCYNIKYRSKYAWDENLKNMILQIGLTENGLVHLMLLHLHFHLNILNKIKITELLFAKEKKML